MAETTAEAGVRSVARGVEVAKGGSAPDGPGPEHRAFGALIGRWITEGETVNPDGSRGVPIVASDVYEWVTGGFFVVHPAHGRIGDTPVGGTEILGYDAAAGEYFSVFYDSFGNVGRSRLTLTDGVWRWQGERTRCTQTWEDGAWLARHERSDDGVTWQPSMVVRLRKAG